MKHIFIFFLYNQKKDMFLFRKCDKVSKNLKGKFLYTMNNNFAVKHSSPIINHPSHPSGAAEGAARTGFLSAVFLYSH